jgi:hypothetical protein
MTASMNIHKSIGTEKLIRDFEHQVTECDDMADLRQSLLQVIQATVGVSGAALFPFCLSSISASDIILHSEYTEPKDIGTKTISSMPILSSELGGPVSSFLSSNIKTRNWIPFFGRAVLEKSWTYGEFCRSFKLEYVMSAIMGTPQIPLGVLIIARSKNERSFSDRETATTESIRRITESALQRLSKEERESTSMSDVLFALANGLPHKCSIWDSNGNLVWLNTDFRRALSPNAFPTSQYS